MKLTLINGWQKFWRMWSVRLTFVGATLLFYLQEVPDAAITVWSNLPDDFKSVLPPDFARYVGYALIGLGLVSRVIKQRKLDTSAHESEVH